MARVLNGVLGGPAPPPPGGGGRKERRGPKGGKWGFPAIDAHHRSPGESRVKIEDSAKGPTACDLFHPAIAAVKEDRLPNAKDFECLANVVVTASVIQVEVERVGLFRVWCGARVHTLRPAELSVRGKLVRELML